MITKPFFLALVSLVFSVFARAESPIGFFGPACAKPVPASTLKVYPPSMDLLEGEGLQAVQFDLNGDGKKEFIRVYGPSLCGTGGCPYEIFDGVNKRNIGQLFGSPVYVFPQKVNGWPVLTVYSHGSSASGSYTSLVFDGRKYIEVSSVYLYEKSVDELFDRNKAVPKIE